MKTKCFTYEVTMVIQILADDEKSAKTTLDDRGGYISDRQVKLLKTTNLTDAPKLNKVTNLGDNNGRKK
jgi:hypothetical protein